MLSSGFKEARKEFGTDFTVTGVSGTFRGVMRDTEYMIALGSGGFTADYAGALEYFPDDVTVAIGGKVTINGTVYRVEKYGDADDTDPTRTLFLTGVNK